MATTEGANTQPDGGTPANPNPGGPPAGAGAKSEAKPEIKVEAKPETKEVKIEAKPETKEVKALEDDEEIEKKTPYTITGEKIIKRVDRAVRSAFRTHFGTDDPEVVKAKLKTLEGFETKAETERRSKLEETDKLKEDLAKEKQRAEALEAKATKEREGRVIDRQETRLQKIAGKHIDADYIDEVALPKFAVHLRKTKTMAEINAMTDDDIEGYFKELAEKKPKLAKEGAASKEETTKRGLTNGARTDTKPVAGKSGTQVEKTARPGQPNSMTKAEISAQGYKW